MRPHSATCKTIRQTNRRASKRGFTLIELLVVVAIIALLISILLPSLARARDTANCTRCMSNLRDMLTASKTFAESHKGRFQIVGVSYSTLSASDASIYQITTGDNPAPSTAARNEKHLMSWPAVLARESSPKSVVRSRVYPLTMANRPVGGGWGTESGQLTDDMIQHLPRFEQLICPSAKNIINKDAGGAYTFWGKMTYNVNFDICGLTPPSYAEPSKAKCWKEGVPGKSGVGQGERLKGRLEGVYQPSNVAMFTDGGADYSTPWKISDQNAPKNMGSKITENSTSGDASGIAGPMLEHMDLQNGCDRLPYTRHRNGSANIGYVDGHCSFGKRIGYTPRYGSEKPWQYVPAARVSPYRPGLYPMQ